MSASLILLRGLTREQRHWGAFLPQLQAGLPDASITRIDLPGTGACCAMRSPLTIAAILENVRAQLHIATPATATAPQIVIGLSLGGMLAAEWAHAYPQELAGCVLINTSLRSFSPPAHRLQWRAWPDLFCAARAWREAEACERAIWKLTSNREVDPRVLGDWVAYRKDAGVSATNAVRQLLAAARYRGQRTAPAVPTLLLASEGDRLVAPSCARRIAQAWQVPLRLHPWAGHDLPLDDGRWVVAAVAGWLNSLASGANDQVNQPVSTSSR